nr:MAG TPA: hypothetical protein [Microviridae sp.]
MPKAYSASWLGPEEDSPTNKPRELRCAPPPI